MYPQVLKTSSSHEEGCIRRWSLATNRFVGQEGKLVGVEVEQVVWETPAQGGRPQMKKTGKSEVIPADLVFLAMGFVSPRQDGPVSQLSLATDARGNIAVDASLFTGTDKVFAAGDARQRRFAGGAGDGFGTKSGSGDRPLSEKTARTIKILTQR